MRDSKRVAQERKLAAVVGRRITELRKAKGWNQVDLEAAMKEPVARSTIGNFESGQRLPSLYTLDHIAKALGVPLAALVLSPETSERERRAYEQLVPTDAPAHAIPMAAESVTTYRKAPAKKR